jgi:predicted ferric reductase
VDAATLTDSMCLLVTTKIIKHPSDVVEIRMRKKKFKYKPGQYLYLNCPALSFYEWHPFTISSAPHEDFVSCHIRVCAYIAFASGNQPTNQPID